ncbi:hypothetical protein [Xenorhabdus lircayensis]|uniref:Uncharacterized protein n=1 Tax=Xenorhabdus lircayensis TaxID=2763499 RepID=A0ABS0U1J4_9GAMM|nr:hypothetical protein [Xenorhabdus lircayensis]MBI6547756.1 hypothetical protein [Xenorhabdus lircayensis]
MSRFIIMRNNRALLNETVFIFSKPFIDINEYVVPYKEAMNHQALWAKEGVIQIIDDCELHGQKITIKPS